MTTTSSLIILVLSILSFASAVVVQRDGPCFPFFSSGDPTPLPAVVGVNDNGGWVVNRTGIGAVVTTSPGGGEQIRIILAINDPGERAIMLPEADLKSAISAGANSLENALFNDRDTKLFLDIACQRCITTPPQVGDEVGQLCTIKPADDPLGRCATNDNGIVNLLPCTGSNDQKYNFVIV